jgi:hypothetical protein
MTKNLISLLYTIFLLNFTVKSTSKVASLAIFLTFILILSVTLQEAYASSRSPYESGYDHGCDDAGISNPSDRYINQPEKGPAYHTSEFMNGYDAGFNSCGSSSNYEPETYRSNGQSSARSTQSNPQECKNDVNEFGDFMSNFLPGSKVITKYGAEIVC